MPDKMNQGKHMNISGYNASDTYQKPLTTDFNQHMLVVEILVIQQPNGSKTRNVLDTINNVSRANIREIMRINTYRKLLQPSIMRGVSHC